MTNERFEHDLKSVLREIAGGEAPMSLRNRVTDLIDQAPLSRRLWFSPPMKLSLAAVAAVAVVAIAVLVFRPPIVGPTPSQTAEPTASASATGAEPTPTVEPTAVPTPAVAAWTGLDWTADVVGTTDGANIYNILPWNGQYVGAGSVSPVIGTFESGDPMRALNAAFFTSPDGTHWTKTYQGSDDVGDDSGAIPHYLVSAGSGLLAVGSGGSVGGRPLLWWSDDGLTWTGVDSSSWRNALANDSLISVAAGPRGVVAVGAIGSMCCANPQGLPLIIHSADGVTWDRLELSTVFDKGYFSDVTAYPGGFAIVGRVGEKEVLGAEPAVGTPAAWTSADGVTWLAAEVEGSEAPGASLFTVVAGADGLFATGRQTDTTELSGQGPRSGWASTDGRSWQLLGEMGADLPLAIDLPLATGYPTNVVGDGAHMVMFGRESCKTTELSAWTSLDGVTWTQLAFSGSTDYLTLIPGPICNDDGTEGSMVGALSVMYAAVMPDGVFVVGSSSAPTAPTYWFLTATTQ